MAEVSDHGTLVKVNGVNLWHRITGEGEAVVQIHGAGFGHYNTDPCTPVLADHFKVIDHDLRGYGHSDKPETVYHLTPCAMPQRKLTSIKVPNTGLSKRVLLAFSKPPKTSTLTCE